MDLTAELLENSDLATLIKADRLVPNFGLVRMCRSPYCFGKLFFKRVAVFSTTVYCWALFCDALKATFDNVERKRRNHPTIQHYMSATSIVAVLNVLRPEKQACMR